MAFAYPAKRLLRDTRDTVRMAEMKNAAPSKDARFTTTHWSVVLAARRSSSPDYRDALNALCEAYWYPIYAYLRRRGYSIDDAEDHTQGFFAALIEKQGLRHADPEQGRFRSYLLGALKHYLSDAEDYDRAQKRGGGCTIVSLDTAHGENQLMLESSSGQAPDQLFDKSWALTLLHRAMRRLKDESVGSCKPEVFKRLVSYLAPAGDDVPYSETAVQLDMSEGAVKAAVYRLRKRYRALLKDEIARTVAKEDQVEEEIQFLFAALSV